MAVHLQSPTLHVNLKTLFAQGYETVGQYLACESLQTYGTIAAMGKTVFPEKDTALILDMFSKGKDKATIEEAGGQWLQTSR